VIAAMLYDVIVIGAGISGASVARELSRYKLKIAILEKNNDVAEGTTKANSAIVHCGYDPVPGTLKARFNVLGNPLFDRLSEELDVPFKRTGSMVVAFNDEELQVLQDLYDRGMANGVKRLRILDAEEVAELEPNLNDTVVGALLAPDCGIVCPFELTVALTENALENGAQLFLNRQVEDIQKIGDEFKVITNDGVFKTRYIINCAGLHADEIYGMVTESDFRITPRRGQYFVLDKTAGNLVSMPIFQCPGKMGKGVLVLPTVHGNLLVGPDSEDVDEKTNFATTRARLDYVRAEAAKTCSRIPFNQCITQFTGLRATPDGGDFIIGASDRVKGFINVAGIESPGLTSAPAIALHIVEIMKEITGGLEEKEDFNPRRRKVIRFSALSPEEKAALIKKDPLYGRIVCRCEQVTEGEIVDAIRRKAGATSLDGIKRRVRPGMGRCQGGFCSSRTMEILSRELQISVLDVVKKGKDSRVLTGTTKKGIPEEGRR